MMKHVFLLLSALFIGLIVMGQKDYKGFFYPDSVLVNNEIVTADTTSVNIDRNGKTRFVLWGNEQGKISMKFKVKDVGNKTKIKSRIEVYRKGRWRKPKLKGKFFYEGRIVQLSRWSADYVIFHNVNGKTESGSQINKLLIGTNGDSIEVNGYVKMFWW